MSTPEAIIEMTYAVPNTTSAVMTPRIGLAGLWRRSECFAPLGASERARPLMLRLRLGSGSDQKFEPIKVVPLCGADWPRWEVFFERCEIHVGLAEEPQSLLSREARNPCRLVKRGEAIGPLYDPFERDRRFCG